MAELPRLGAGLRLLLASQGVAPMALKVPLLQRLGPQRAARMAGHMAPDDLYEMIVNLPVDFLAEVTTHLDPCLILDTYLRLPETLHLDVARELLARGYHATAARYCECFPPVKVKMLLFGLNDPDGVLQIARHIQNMDLIVDALRSVSVGYLCTLTEAAVRSGNVAISVRVLGGLPAQRQADVCAHLPPATLKRLLPPLLKASGEALRVLLPERLREPSTEPGI